MSGFCCSYVSQEAANFDHTSTQLDNSRVSQKSRAIIICTPLKTMSGDLMWALTNGEMDDIRSTLVTTEDVNRELPSGRLPLNIAADYGQAEVLEYLISKGAKINVQDKFGMTPLISAICEGHTSCVKILLEKGADKNFENMHGLTAFKAAETDALKDLVK